MVAAVNPVMELVNEPVPVPSVVLLSAVVGLALVLQQTPLAETAAPPSLVIFPPLVAVVVAISDTATVAATVGLAAQAEPPTILVQATPLYTWASP